MGKSITSRILGFYFTALQAIEYYEVPFSIADRVYGSTFFVATRFQGLHVICFVVATDDLILFFSFQYQC